MRSEDEAEKIRSWQESHTAALRRVTSVNSCRIARMRWKKTLSLEEKRKLLPLALAAWQGFESPTELNRVRFERYLVTTRKIQKG